MCERDERWEAEAVVEDTGCEGGGEGGGCGERGECVGVDGSYGLRDIA